MNKKVSVILAASCMWAVTAQLYAEQQVPVEAIKVFVAPEQPVPMEIKKEEAKPVEASQGAQLVSAKLMNKGVGHDNWVIKMVSACDQNNVWCVANDGSKDAVFQLTAKGLEHRFDGVYVAAGKRIVTVINAQNEVFELEGGEGTNWRKIEGLKLSKVSRPSVNVGWGLLEKEQGRYTFFAYDDEEHTWEVVNDNEGQSAEGIVEVFANAEEAVLALNNKGELLRGDLHRKQMYEDAKQVIKEVSKEKKTSGKERKGKKSIGKGKKGKKSSGMVDRERDTDGDGIVSDAEKSAYAAAHPEKDKKGKGKKGRGKGKKGKKSSGMVDLNNDGQDDRDTNRDGKVSDEEESAYAAAHPEKDKKGKGKKGRGKGKKGKKSSMVDLNNDGQDDRDTNRDGKVSREERRAAKQK